jgi:hypothetical protein
VEDRVTGTDVREAVGFLADALTQAFSADWSRVAGTLRWSCQETLRHISDCLLWYALNLGGRTTDDGAWDFSTADAAPPDLLASCTYAGAVLADVVGAAPADARGWHPAGMADRSGFAAMGCDEILVHAADIGAGLGVDVSPPRALCGRVVHRLFPWAPAGFDPWSTLLWCNGRAELPDHARLDRSWVWHCAPLAEWDGTIPKWAGP